MALAESRASNPTTHVHPGDTVNTNITAVGLVETGGRSQNKSYGSRFRMSRWSVLDGLLCDCDKNRDRRFPRAHESLAVLNAKCYFWRTHTSACPPPPPEHNMA